MMKYIFIICLFIAIVSTAYTQKKYEFKPHHEINLSQGIFPLIPSLFSGWGTGCCMPNSTLDAYTNALYAKGETITTGAISVTYMCNTRKWFSYGGSVSFYGIYQKKYNRVTDEVVGRDYNQSFSTMGLARFIYLNREFVRLYGTIGLGIGFNKETDQLENKDLSDSQFFPAINFSPFGIQIGKKLYGLMECGYSANGIFLAGIGYKF